MHYRCSSLVLFFVFALTSSVPSPWALFPSDSFEGKFEDLGLDDKQPPSNDGGEGEFTSFQPDEFDLLQPTVINGSETSHIVNSSLELNSTTSVNNATEIPTVTKSAIDLLMDLSVTDDKVANTEITRTQETTEAVVGDNFEIVKGFGEVDNLQPKKSFILNQDETTSTVASTQASNFDTHFETGDKDGQSIIDFNPRNNTFPSRFIHFSTTNSNDWQPYVDNLESFLSPYEKEAQQKNVHCDFERVLEDGEACRFDLVYLGPSCTKRNHFGYSIGKPCVILSPAAIPNWVPAPYGNDSTGVPDEVHRLMRIFNANFMFVTCDGEKEADKKAIGPMAYLPPYQGFPSYFFPYRDASNYIPPLMAIEFLNPANSTRIDVECRAWAKNLDEQLLKTSFKFGLQIN